VTRHQRQHYDHQRDQQPWRRWYKTAQWQALAKHQLTIEPLCAMCAVMNRVTAATVCDHLHRHDGDPQRFWSGPFQSLCAIHHDTTKQRQENRGHAVGNDAQGRPTDPTHPWNA
jgi:5-methylcytosine-specific restriction protein A